jgi:hypothetical protein
LLGRQDQPRFILARGCPPWWCRRHQHGAVAGLLQPRRVISCTRLRVCIDLAVQSKRYGR